MKYNFEDTTSSQDKISTKQSNANKVSKEIPQSVSDGKVVITGDDVLIEYVQRLIKILKEIPEIQDSEIIDQNIEKFIVHFVWHKEDY